MVLIHDISNYKYRLYIFQIFHYQNVNPYDNVSYWAKFVDGQQFEGNWGVSTNYQKGDIVYYGGYLYVAKQNSLNNNPTNTTYWDVYAKGYEEVADGSWFLSYIVNDDDIWARVKDGEFKGFSVEGFFDFDVNEEERQLNAIYNAVKKAVEKWDGKN